MCKYPLTLQERTAQLDSVDSCVLPGDFSTVWTWSGGTRVTSFNILLTVVYNIKLARHELWCQYQSEYLCIWHSHINPFWETPGGFKQERKMQSGSNCNVSKLWDWIMHLRTASSNSCGLLVAPITRTLSSPLDCTWDKEAPEWNQHQHCLTQ